MVCRNLEREPNGNPRNFFSDLRSRELTRASPSASPALASATMPGHLAVRSLVMISILIADPHAPFRRTLREVLDSEDGFSVVAETDDSASSIEQAEALMPSIALIDAHVAGIGGLDLTRALGARKLSTRIIFLTMYKDREILLAAIEAGAQGYLLKDFAILEIAEAIRAVMAGRTYVTPRLLSVNLRLMLDGKL